ncbi:fungal-specific transcription factor domain-containing protein [Xylariaceae sp. FL1272]|nr:fungal-specific transcription factor domain-containing protein [Xylariaceae sp. FL1272]
MAEIHETATRLMRKSFACDECKRRKIRCSGGDRCANCFRDAKECRYSSPSQRLATLQRRLRESEALRADMEKAWKVHLPDLDLETALRNLRRDSADEHDKQGDAPPNEQDAMSIGTPFHHDDGARDERTVESSEPPVELANAEDYEFDESHDVEGSIDGMGFLTADPHKAGYTGPQSGIAALKFLRSLPPYLPITYSSPLTVPDDQEVPEVSCLTQADVNRYIDEYFSLFHIAYPILHEGTFRARVSGALAKPRDGSWPLLYNSVLAIGAFVSGPTAMRNDLPFCHEARKHLSMDILEKGSLCYVQGLTLFANYLQKRNKPNAGFILIGIAFSMALAIGLHREFDATSTSPFTMETRRRVWWTLFIFISGAQLALGRPVASLIGVNVQLPANLDDSDLAVDMEQMPPGRLEATVSSCLIAQVKLAKIANTVHNELLTHRRPSYAKAMNLEQNVKAWWNDLPPFFNETAVTDSRLQPPMRILLWRSFNLRIVLNRPFLFETIAAGTQLNTSVEPINSCLTAADECVASICGFVNSLGLARRGFAWYATAWLITASFLQATCLIYSPAHPLAVGWKTSLHKAVDCLQILGSSLDIALRARDIIINLLEDGSLPVPSPARTMNPISTTLSRLGMNVADNPAFSSHQAPGDFSAAWMEDSFTWPSSAGSDAEFLGAAGGLTYGNVFDLS